MSGDHPPNSADSSSSGELPPPEKKKSSSKLPKIKDKSDESGAKASASSSSSTKVRDLPSFASADSGDVQRPKMSKTTSMMPAVGKKSIKTTQSAANIKKNDLTASPKSAAAASTMRVSDKDKNPRKKIEISEPKIEKLAPISDDVRHFGRSFFQAVWLPVGSGKKLRPDLELGAILFFWHSGYAPSPTIILALSLPFLSALRCVQSPQRRFSVFG